VARNSFPTHPAGSSGGPRSRPGCSAAKAAATRARRPRRGTASPAPRTRWPTARSSKPRRRLRRRRAEARAGVRLEAGRGAGAPGLLRGRGLGRLSPSGVGQCLVGLACQGPGGVCAQHRAVAAALGLPAAYVLANRGTPGCLRAIRPTTKTTAAGRGGCWQERGRARGHGHGHGHAASRHAKNTAPQDKAGAGGAWRCVWEAPTRRPHPGSRAGATQPATRPATHAPVAASRPGRPQAVPRAAARGPPGLRRCIVGWREGEAADRQWLGLEPRALGRQRRDARGCTRSAPQPLTGSRARWEQCRRRGRAARLWLPCVNAMRMNDECHA
jgi:hypothetical protein